MKISQHLAYRISVKAMTHQKGGYSKMIAAIASATVAIGIATLIISSNVYKGFKQEIVKKLFCIAPHIEITKFDTKHTFEEVPLAAQDASTLSKLESVERVELYIQKSGLLKSPQAMAGVIVRGLDATFNQENFQRHIVAGGMMPFDTASRKILIGQKLANQLQASIDSTLVVYFVNQSSRSTLPRPRKLSVAGIYRTGIEEIDGHLVLCHISLLRELNRWDSTQVGGYGLYVRDFDQLNSIFEDIQDQLPSDLYAERINERHPHFFEWFIIIGQNVTLILTIILFVVCFNVAASMLILIIEKTSLIGTLKALGADSMLVRRIFFYAGLKICLRGFFWGNLLGVFVSWLQKKFQILPLKAEMYYLDVVPISYDWSAMLAHNVMMLAVVFCALFVPTAVILSVNPIKAIKFQ